MKLQIADTVVHVMPLLCTESLLPYFFFYTDYL